jgi:hypothetical protein
MVTQGFGFMAGKGEILDQAFERLGITFTNNPNENEAVAAQREKMEVYGAAWLQRTAESAWIAREGYLKKKKPLVVRTASDISHAESVTAHYLQQAMPAPSSAIPGNPTNSLSANPAEKSSPNASPVQALLHPVQTPSLPPTRRRRSF